MDQRSATLGAVAGAGLLLAGLASFPFLPLASADTSSWSMTMDAGMFGPFAFTFPAFELDATPWGMAMGAGGEDGFVSWAGADEAPAALVAAGPLHLLALLGLGIGVALALAGRLRAAGVAWLCGLLGLAVAVTLTFVGLAELEDVSWDPAAGLWTTVIAAVAVGVCAAIALGSPPAPAPGGQGPATRPAPAPPAEASGGPAR